MGITKAGATVLDASTRIIRKAHPSHHEAEEADGEVLKNSEIGRDILIPSSRLADDIEPIYIIS